MAPSLTGVWLGRREYGPVLALQRALHAARVRGEGSDVALLVEHQAVVTLGKSTRREHLLAPETVMHAAGFEIAEVERGGDVTLHGPGQLVAYPIIRLDAERRDVRRYVGDLVETMRRTVLDHGVASGPVPGMVGLWVDRQDPSRWPGPETATHLAKIGALGVRIARWVTMHGFALNLGIDLELYRYIVPCGIREHPVTSLAALTGQSPTVAAVAPAAFAHLAARLGAAQAELRDGSTWTLPPDAALAAYFGS